MTEELGIGYIRRVGNDNAKAGNLNHALGVTSGEFILQLDADHVPLPNIIERLIGYFNDDGVAFVQSPQDFYNTDSFTHVVNDEGHRMWEENRIFFSLIQPGKDTWGAAFFCGSCGMFRRAALEQIGGFSTRSVTEDMETSIVLHGRGRRSRYHRETLAYGLSPASATQYHVQRLRWGTGAMQILRKMNPLRYPGLTLRQRVQYFTSCIDYLDGVQKLVFYLSPIVFFATGLLPVSVNDSAFLARLVPYMILSLLSFELLSRGTGWFLHAERFGMTRFFTYILALAGFFRSKPVKFAVTPKSVTDVPFRVYAPQLAIAVLSIASLVWAVVASRFGWIHYTGGLRSAAIWVNGAWLLWNLYFALSVVRQSIRSRQQRHDYRFIESLPLEFEIIGRAMPERLTAITQDLNPTGVSFRAIYRLEPGTRIRLPLGLASGEYAADAEIVRVAERATRYGTVYVHGAQFVDLPVRTRDAIELHCTHHSVPLWRKRYRESVPVFAHAFERLKDVRIGRRREVRLPVAVRVCAPDMTECELGLGMLEEMSDSGARLVLEHPVEPGSPVNWQVPGTSIGGKGTAVFNRAFESMTNVRFTVGVRCERDRTIRRGALPRTSWRSAQEATSA
jgi:cellulose synthase (UDP-forming)